MQKAFIEKAIDKLKDDPQVLGLAVAGSWITNEIDKFSDVDLILFTSEKISGDKDMMMAYAQRFGKLLSAFTGEHVGEPRLLICLYDDPLLHVDIKFLTPEEYTSRIEDPVVVFERENVLTNLMKASKAQWPYPDYQWIEDRFWTWVHYATLKLGRGEDFEALDFLSYVRSTVLAPLLQIKNRHLPRGLRKVETRLANEDFETLKSTVASYDKQSLFTALENSIALYRLLRKNLFGNDVQLQKTAEEKVMEYLDTIKQKSFDPNEKSH
ncbi:MAG: nucleotidyltransferase domain-containing protein [Chitinophagaceae bacterium]|nr:MAG: nucleotidyltransferase domain-containing protein [Chitinophagaceae bacterium]